MSEPRIWSTIVDGPCVVCGKQTLFMYVVDGLQSLFCLKCVKKQVCKS